MVAIHIRTYGLDDDAGAALIETKLTRISGVAGVIVAKSMHLTSVLYEESIVSWKTIVRTIRSLGFDAQVVRPVANDASRGNGDATAPARQPSARRARRRS